LNSAAPLSKLPGVKSGPTTSGCARRLRAVLLAGAGMALGGCISTVDNDAAALGGNDDRWYTGGFRSVHDFPADLAEDAPWYQAGAAAVAGHLQLLPAGEDDRPTFTTVSLVGGQQLYTPADVEVPQVIEDDRPYAGWLYAGMVRYDTWLDPDPLVRDDVEHSVELDVGIVGPAALAEESQSLVHEVVTSEEPEGWDNQLGNEIGIVLRAARSARHLYVRSGREGSVALDAISRLDGALGNVDTHAGVGGLLRVGWNLPRSFDPVSGDRSRLLPGGARSPEEAASFYFFTGLEARGVLRNIFLDGNTFRESHSIDKEEFLGALRAGMAWEWSRFRFAYTFTRLTDEFEGQPEQQSYGSITLGWTQVF
jgi:lipid A 3-O-deacylase